MFSISQLLDRVRSIQAKGILQRKIVHDSIQKNIAVDVPIEEIVIKSAIVSLRNISQSAKSAIYIKKQVILNDINTGQTNPIARDIR